LVGIVVLGVVVVGGLCVPVGVFAAEAVPGFTVSSFAAPTNFSGGDTARCVGDLGALVPPCDSYTVAVTNAGGAVTDESPITIADALPAGLTVQKVSLFFRTRTLEADYGAFVCSQVVPVQCVWPSNIFGVLKPDDKLTMVVYVTVDPGVSGALLNAATVSGGGARTVSSPQGPGEGNGISAVTPAFGASELGFFISGQDGTVDRQAGDHPYELTTTLGLRTDFRELPDQAGGGSGIGTTSVEDLKDVSLDLPLGFVGSALAAPQCTLAQLSSEQECPTDTQVGEIETEPLDHIDGAVNSPIWNLVPERGVPAEFGFRDGLKGAHVFYVHVVPTPLGYVVRTTISGIAQISLTRTAVTFFGDPAAKDGSGNAEVPFFTNPTNCSGEPLRAVAHMDSWQHPGRVNPDGSPDLSDPNWTETVAESPPVTGCNALQFAPQLSAQPTTSQADAPSGFNFELSQAQSENVGTLAAATLKKAVVTLPAGLTVNPGAADGLAACSTAQIGWVGPSPVNFTAAAPACPEASKIGTLELATPVISRQLTGEIYLAAQNENPFNTLLAAYIVVDDPVTGVLVKIAGKLLPDPQTGQLTGVFDENPNVPFSDLKLHFFGGPRAALATPMNCGTFSTISELTPWSAPDSGPAASLSDAFVINTGCVGGFSPSFSALSTNVQAAGFTPLVLSFSRSDQDQELGGLSVSLPPGLLAKITGVPLCPDAQANAGSCPLASQVGSVTAGAGPGPNPLFIKGSAYLTGPYKGAPYGLVVVVPAVAGPFNLGNVVVRQALYIDPHDAHATAVSDAFPTIIQGIPIRLRRVDVEISRPGGFTLNPTSCEKLEFSGNITSTANTSAAVSAPFQVTNCGALKFAPKLTVSTSGKTSKLGGASLTTTLAYPNAPLGSQANIASVKVSLPKQLPSRLTTLQKACLAQTFEANPAHCPAASIVGQAKVITPLLPLPLTGPAYFVSHGNEAFPSLTIVLQGNNVTVDLIGSTFISKTGITSTTFKTTPDVPFNTFTLTLPQGPHSALAANGNLCKQTLTMPTIIRAQNGDETRQTNKILITHCTKHHTTKHHPKHTKHHKK
jgi:uncharacterized repeat protein (TIGR01451 family)